LQEADAVPFAQEVNPPIDVASGGRGEPAADVGGYGAEWGEGDPEALEEGSPEGNDFAGESQQPDDVLEFLAGAGPSLLKEKQLVEHPRATFIGEAGLHRPSVDLDPQDGDAGGRPRALVGVDGDAKA
jgi:hypothetical protein